MASIQHLLETRFSVRMGTDLAPAWLEERVELLRRFTLPAVVAQTTDAFAWIVLCDQATDPHILGQLRTEEHQLPVLRISLTSAERTPLAIIKEAVLPDTDVLITTRLDSDDAIADGYLEAVQEYATAFHRSSLETLLVNFPNGYRLDVQKQNLYSNRMTNSPFHSLFERPQHCPPKSVMSAADANLLRRYKDYKHLAIPERQPLWHRHVMLHQHYPTHQDESMRAWMIVVHGDNLLNRIPEQARKLPAGARPSGFTIQAGELHRG